MRIVVLLCFAFFVGQSSAIVDYYLDSYCYGLNWPIDLSILDSVRLHLTSSYQYANNLNCSVTLTTSSSSQLMFFFRSFDVESTASCQYDSLELHDGRSLRSPYASGFYGRQCGSYIGKSVYTTSNSALTLWFRSDSSVTDTGFDMIITSYHTGLCHYAEYSCGNGRCVANYLTCNDYNPCGDYSDCSLTVGGIAGIVVGCACSAIIIFVIVLVIVRRRRRYVSTPGLSHQQVAVVSGGYGYNQPVPAQYSAPPPAYPGNAQYPQYS